jgi:hypothetical protein
MSSRATGTGSESTRDGHGGGAGMLNTAALRLKEI